MPILNYTTDIPVTDSMGQVIGKLAAAGAVAITTLYVSREPVGVEFVIQAKGGNALYRLPVRVDAIHAVLLRDPKVYARGAKAYSREQAARVGWRIIKDWVEAQMALIEAEMVTLEEVMFPYQLAGPSGKTLFQLWNSHQLALPPGKVEK